MVIIASRLRALRKSKGLTQKQVGEAVGIAERNYRRYEAGTTDPLTPATAAIAEYFGVSIDYLVGRTENPEVNR